MLDSVQFQRINYYDDYAFVERGLSYDGNGNLLTLQRTENGAVSNDFSYTYDGNRLISLTDGSMSYAYAYDPNGNLTRDGFTPLI